MRAKMIAKPPTSARARLVRPNTRARLFVDWYGKLSLPSLPAIRVASPGLTSRWRLFHLGAVLAPPTRKGVGHDT